MYQHFNLYGLYHHSMVFLTTSTTSQEMEAYYSHYTELRHADIKAAQNLAGLGIESQTSVLIVRQPTGNNISIAYLILFCPSQTCISLIYLRYRYLHLRLNFED